MIGRCFRTGLVGAFVLPLLVSCTNVMLDENTRQILAGMDAYRDLHAASDAEALAIVERSGDPAQRHRALLVALWSDRPDLLANLVARGVQLGQPIGWDRISDYNVDYRQASVFDPPAVVAASASSRRHPVVSVPPRLLVRSERMLDLFLDAGVTFDDEALQDGLLTAILFGREVALAERYLAMGASLEALVAERGDILASFLHFGEPEVVAWALAQGLDPDMRMAEYPPEYGQGTIHDGVLTYYYQFDFTPLHNLAQTFTSNLADRMASIARARVLVEAGADVNAKAIFGYSVDRDAPIGDWTPLHALYSVAPSSYVNDELARYLVSQGADPNGRTTDGRRPVEMAGHMQRQGELIARRHQANRQQAASSRSGGDDANLFGKMLALGGMAAITAYGAGQGLGSQALAVGMAGATDIVTDGEANALQSIQSGARQSGAAAATPRQAVIDHRSNELAELLARRSANDAGTSTPAPRQTAARATAPVRESGGPAGAAPQPRADAGAGVRVEPEAGTGCENWFIIDRIDHSFLPIEVATPVTIDASSVKKPIRGGDPADFAVALESLHGSGNVDRFMVHVLIPGRLMTSRGGDFIDNNLVPGLENGAVGTLDAYRGNEYANFRTNFDYGRDRPMGSLTIESDGPGLRGSFRFEAIEDGYPYRGEHYRTAVHGRFCLPG